MIFTHFLLSACVLLCEIHSSTAKALISRPNTILGRRNDVNEVLRRKVSEPVDSAMVAREALPQPASSGSITVPVMSSSTSNTTTACLAAVSQFDNSTNPAGITACYALPYLNTTTRMFTAELHLYSMGTPSGSFADIPQKDVLFTMAYSAASITTFTKRMMKRTSIETRASGPTQLQVSTFIGSLSASLQLAKLNSTELMSLLIPTIILEARTPTAALVTSNMTADDIAYFPAGVFSTQPPASILAADQPAMAAEAVAKAAAFILPGTTLGFFPTGLIVTGSWTVLLFAALGAGTLGRVHFRRQYRSRITRPQRRRG